MRIRLTTACLRACLQVTEQQLRAIFQPFGEIVYVKIPSGKGCGFVQFTQRSNAETAMLQLNGQVQGQSSQAQSCESHLSPVVALWLCPSYLASQRSSHSDSKADTCLTDGW